MRRILRPHRIHASCRARSSPPSPRWWCRRNMPRGAAGAGGPSLPSRPSARPARRRPRGRSRSPRRGYGGAARQPHRRRCRRRACCWPTRCCARRASPATPGLTMRAEQVLTQALREDPGNYDANPHARVCSTSSQHRFREAIRVAEKCRDAMRRDDPVNYGIARRRASRARRTTTRRSTRSIA